MANYYGTPGNDTYRGTEDDDWIEGRAGDDRLCGYGGQDRLDGGDGNDSLQAGSGGDELLGGLGDDVLRGDEDGDRLEGGDGNDLLEGGGGSDDLYTGEGQDRAYGGDDNDDIVGGEGNNVLDGGNGNDFLLGVGGDDSLDGGAGQDIFEGGDGRDILNGGSGNDFMRGGSGLDRFDGGSNDGVDLSGFGLVGDRISFQSAGITQGAVADLRTGIISNDGFGNRETMVGIESLSGDTPFADSYFGNDLRNYLSASFGDTAMGFGGMDIFNLGGAPVLVDGGLGIDTIMGFTGEKRIPDSDGDGQPEIIAAIGGVTVDLVEESVVDSHGDEGIIRGIENFGGSLTAADDILRGDDQDNVIRGLGGTDLIDGRGGSDTLSYSDFGFEEHYGYFHGHGAVEVDLRAGYSEESDLKTGTLRADTPRFGRDTLTGIENIVGSGLGDHLYGDIGDNVIATGAGNDVVNGRLGIDTLDYSSARGTVIVDLARWTVVEKGSGAAPRQYIESGPANEQVVHMVEADDAKDSRDRVYFMENVIGTRHADDITGDAVANVLDGGGGNDRLAGRGGDDLYLVESLGDVVVEAAGEGFDMIRTTSHYFLAEGSHVERLEAVGALEVHVYGNELANEILGSEGDDMLWGLEGNDRLDGGLGRDVLSGGDGNDTYRIDETLDLISETLDGGIDTVEASRSYELGLGIERLKLMGTEDPNGGGNSLDNVMFGNSGANTLNGMAGKDYLLGGLGNDALTGSRGADVLTGGAGRDLFRFGENHSGVTEADADRILDFTHGQDRIDLRVIDADTTTEGDGAFRLVGEGAFTGEAGELRFDQLNGGDLRLEGDVNGDSLADFAIYISRGDTLAASDFLL